ncbi:MAG: hypothetical protein WBV82_28635 [Myxococcaceae bacterium]
MDFAASPADEGLFLTGPELPESVTQWRATPVVAYDGRLDPRAAPLFSREGGVLLVALREETGVARWELDLIARFLSRASLMPPDATVQEIELASMEDLAQVADLVRSVASAAGATQASQDVTSDVVYELCANALLDAPVDEAGQPRYAHRRHEAPEIDPADACRVELAVDEGLLYVCVTDRFGRLTPAPLAKTISGLGQRARVDASGGGAGLGFRRLLDQGQVLAARVVPDRSTEVLCVVSLTEIRRRSAGMKSVFFLTERD